MGTTDLQPQIVKIASKPVRSYAMSGQLYLSKSGWLLLSVPNDFVRGVFASMNEPNIEMPPSEGELNLEAHISVARKEEVDSIPGGGNAVRERGHRFNYSLDKFVEVAPAGWSEMSRAWLLQVRSPELMALRRHYDLGPPKHPFHITVAVRRKQQRPAKQAADKAASDYWRRALSAQFRRPYWNANLSFLDNLAENSKRVRSRGRSLYMDDVGVRRSFMAANPELRLQSVLDTLGGRPHPLATTPVDKLLLGLS